MVRYRNDHDGSPCNGPLVDEGDPQRAALVIGYVVVVGHVGKVGQVGKLVIGGAGHVHDRPPG
jgi:hypothetical protein